MGPPGQAPSLEEDAIASGTRSRLYRGAFPQGSICAAARAPTTSTTAIRPTSRIPVRLPDNIGTGAQTTVNEVYRLIANVLGVSSPARYSAARTGEVHAIALDPTEAGQELGCGNPRSNSQTASSGPSTGYATLVKLHRPPCRCVKVGAVTRCNVRRRSALAAESALATGEDRSLRVSQRRAVQVSDRCLTDDHTALPLSQISVNRVTDRADPLAGSGAGTVTASLACSTLLSSMSIPGNCTVGGSVSRSWPPRCRTWAAPEGCRQPGSAAPSGSSGLRRHPARGGRAGHRYWSTE